MNVDHDKDFLYLFLDDIDDHIEEKDGIKISSLYSYRKKQRSIKKLQKTLGRN